MSKRVIIYGGNGALGSALVKYFKSQNWWVASIDLASNEEADKSIAIPGDSDLETQSGVVLEGIKSSLVSEKIDAIINVAGGWAGGNAAHEDFLKNSDMMWKQSVWSSLITAHMASKYLKESGLLAMTGAQAALSATPGMIGYGIAKAAVHHLTKTLASESSGLPKDTVCLAILPVTLDTPNNRKWMPKADFSNWTPLEFVSELLYQWASGSSRPTSGSLVQLITKDSQTELVMT